MQSYMEKITQAADFIQGKLKEVPSIAIILGSGLGPLVNELQDKLEIEYTDIPEFPRTTVVGHEGKLVMGRLGGKYVLCMKGRFHHYEGYDPAQTTFAVRVFRKIGIKNLIVTNAAGGVDLDYKPGDLMVITDHIGLNAPSPLRGPNLEEFGVRFPDMSKAYDKEMIDICFQIAQEINISLQQGVYFFAQGPMYETPAEIRAIRILGGDAVGMSTVPEVIAAVHSGMKVLGISCITNMAAGILDTPLSHEEVMQTGKQVEKTFTLLVSKLVEKWKE